MEFANSFHGFITHLIAVSAFGAPVGEGISLKMSYEISGSGKTVTKETSVIRLDYQAPKFKSQKNGVLKITT